MAEKGLSLIDNKEYQEWFQHLCEEIDKQKLKAAMQLNAATLQHYWWLGNDIIRKQKEQGWGANVINRLSSEWYRAFAGCSALTSVTISNSVTSIGSNAFYGADIPTIISLIENPFGMIGKTSEYRPFSLNTFNNATLYVPKGTIDKYKATDGWKDFVFIEEGDYIIGINSVQNTPHNNTTIYNLNGVRQSEPKKGINIINGKKVVIQ